MRHERLQLSAILLLSFILKRVQVQESISATGVSF